MPDYLNIAWDQLESVRRTAPLVHNITNFVVMHTTANALLALGASPVMAHACEEMEEISSLASALVLNIGTLSPAWVEGMRLAQAAANAAGRPVVIDPVGAGASSYRTQTALDLLRACAKNASRTILRGNASEIAALAGSGVRSKGVDSSLKAHEAGQAASDLALEHGCLVCVSGAVDLVTDGKHMVRLTGGSPLMTRVTGMGCTATAVCAAFAAVAFTDGADNNDDLRLAPVVSAMAVMSAAGGLAAKGCAGPGSFLIAFLDRLYSLSRAELADNIRIEKL
ncbi:MAG: hydroxyethylthiazole kinase [Deltaproteobacteria bacterium]|jgi:hydroxyethylthiazole kinase|nr:hydroxyethylthiazole kinase [Deltaproteobacteria bacterium]